MIAIGPIEIFGAKTRVGAEFAGPSPGERDPDGNYSVVSAPGTYLELHNLNSRTLVRFLSYCDLILDHLISSLSMSLVFNYEFLYSKNSTLAEGYP